MAWIVARLLAVVGCLLVCTTPCAAGQPGAPHVVVLKANRLCVIRYSVQYRDKEPEEYGDDELTNHRVIVVKRGPDGFLPRLTIDAYVRENPFVHWQLHLVKEPMELHYVETVGLWGQPDELNLDLDREVDWGRVAAALGALGVMVALGTLGLRGRFKKKLAQADSTLALTRQRLTESELRTGLFPADGSNPPSIGDYAVVERLGTGGMAVVYRVRNDRGEEFALKLPLPNCLQDEEFKRRFRRELKIGVRLTHRNLVRILDVNGGEEGDAWPYPFLVMELVRGRSLDRLLDPSSPLPTGEALRIAAQILDALVYVHRNGVIHRDIKPSNVMLTGDGRVRVMDFGVAHRQETRGGGGRLTASDEILGTAAYMAPEQIASAPLDSRADLYSLGVVVYEMLAGRMPYGDDTMQIIHQKMTEDLPPITDLCPHVPDEVGAWLSRMIARDREERWADAAQARAELTRLMAGLGLPVTGLVDDRH